MKMVTAIAAPSLSVNWRIRQGLSVTFPESRYRKRAVNV